MKTFSTFWEALTGIGNWDRTLQSHQCILHAREKNLSTAVSQCSYPDHYLDKAIKTGLFDYVWVQFYNNPYPPCQYSNGNPKRLFEYWVTWTSSVLANNIVLLGLPAAPHAAGSGFIAGEVVADEILLYVRESSSYGGVMLALWSRYYDVQTNFSDKIKGNYLMVKSVLKLAKEIGDAIYDRLFFT
ncbi:hypothetical protein PIB30_094122 [Stylosanthes scabra]|uniref:GH18 domain-containing protein n=1 Tax=Stylosanthes scabra TaxID=79078 RepID=A0ABU6SXP4_9FABA|nr:hypothetical protein [Stylosanthes scabra]